MLSRVSKSFLNNVIKNSFFQPLKHLATCENIPSRAVLYVPGSDKKKLQKSLNLKVDCLVLNCEDGVAINMKDEARKNIKEILENPSQFNSGTNICVRINDLSTPFFKDDLETFLTVPNLPETILIPKVHDVQDMTRISQVFQKYRPKDNISIIISIESANGIMYLQDICQEAFNLANSCNFVPVGLLFGGDDYLASIGAAKTEDHSEILYARQKLVNVAKAFELQAIDIVHINFKGYNYILKLMYKIIEELSVDLKQLEEQCLQGARMGYTGKQVIHPMQIETVQKCFSPSAQQIEWASQLIVEYESHQNKGSGAFVFRGNMIDAPLMKQARNIISLSKR